MKNFLFQIFRAAYTIVWACLLFVLGIVTMLNYGTVMSELAYWALWGVAIVATLVFYKLWNLE